MITNCKQIKRKSFQFDIKNSIVDVKLKGKYDSLLERRKYYSPNTMARMALQWAMAPSSTNTCHTAWKWGRLSWA